ncbi:MAG: hypothetical protein ACJAR4_000688 [Psychroserpens sp.]|jgi:hypothetical protein
MPPLKKLIFIGVANSGVNPVPSIVIVEPVVTLRGYTLVTVWANKKGVDTRKTKIDILSVLYLNWVIFDFIIKNEVIH